MIARLEELLASPDLDEAAIEAFIEDNHFPLVEDRRVTFVFRGRADEVFLRHFIFGLPSSQPFERVPGHDLWHVEMELPERSRIEYKIERVWHGRREWIMDPLNPRVADDPYGANSVAHGVGYETPDWTHHDPEARPGALQPVSLSSQVFGGPRDLQVYIPARFRRSSRYPLLIVHDGPDYLRFAELKVVLDNLIHRLEIPPLVAALIHSPDRLVEYAADTRHATFLRDELVPALEQRYPLIARPEARALVGASFGGVAALHAAWTHPGYFGRLLLQSGSFAFSDIGDHGRPPVFDPVAEFVNRFRVQPGRPTEKLFVSCGIYESLIYENRSLQPVLQSTGMDLRYVEAPDGHNWDNWRDRMREALSWLYPGPLWMVYE